MFDLTTRTRTWLKSVNYRNTGIQDVKLKILG